MSSVDAIRAAFKTTIQTFLGANSGVSVYETWPGNPNFPAVVIEPLRADFEGAMNNALDEWHFNVMIFESRADEQKAQKTLDKFITGVGPKSIRQAIYENPTLGLSDSTAVVMSMRGYGAGTKAAGMSVVGVSLVVCVYTDGRT